MRLASYNVEWFDALFDDRAGLLDDGSWSRRHNVTRADQLAALAVVFGAIDADAVMVIEAPDTNKRRSSVAALEAFAARYNMRARKALVGFANRTQQEITLLYDPDKIAARHDPRGGRGGAAPPFDGEFSWTSAADIPPGRVRFSKPPLEAEITLQSGAALRLFGVHVKSRAPHGAHGAREIMAVSIENRRKQLAQCVWLRNRVEDHLSAHEPVIVMGDFNDGPGLDEYEKLFGRSSVEIVLGEPGETGLFDPHAAAVLLRKFGASPTTFRFYNVDKKRYFQALLDYVMVSPDVAATAPHWRIWHPFDDPQCYGNPQLRQALLTASDHFPVTIDLEMLP